MDIFMVRSCSLQEGELRFRLPWSSDLILLVSLNITVLQGCLLTGAWCSDPFSKSMYDSSISLVHLFPLGEVYFIFHKLLNYQTKDPIPDYDHSLAFSTDKEQTRGQVAGILEHIWGR